MYRDHGVICYQCNMLSIICCWHMGTCSRDIQCISWLGGSLYGEKHLQIHYRLLGHNIFILHFIYTVITGMDPDSLFPDPGSYRYKKSIQKICTVALHISMVLDVWCTCTMMNIPLRHVNGTLYLLHFCILSIYIHIHLQVK